MSNINKNLKRILLAVGVIILVTGFVFFIFSQDFSYGQKPTYGLTFSPKYASELELDWQKTYIAILDELKVSHLRLIAYWDEIEKTQDSYDFSDLDWQLNLAADREVKVILTVGRRAPRWPECHDPVWLGNLSTLAAQEQQLKFIETVIKRYQSNSAVTAWQVENEPFLAVFGLCPSPDKQFIKREVSLVRSLDQREIIMTDSGELGDWQQAGKLADVLGTTMYRIVWNRYLGFWDYFFLPPAFYHYKAQLTKFFNKNLKSVIVTELQMEPWTFDKLMIEMSQVDREKSFDLQRFKSNIRYVQKTGLTQVYLWGGEYWYWLKQQGQPQIWQAAKDLWRD